MSEQDTIWAVKGGAIHRKCLKLGIFVSNCSINDDCEACIAKEKVDDKASIRGPKRPNRRKRL
jgi:hypothetical protein